jgi:pyridoxamine 5'-phosphate oxidase
MSLIPLRKEYTLGILERKDLDPDPIVQFKKWFSQASEIPQAEPHAMTLSTADKAGRPSARTVLLRNIDERGFSFFSNYESQKGRDLAENPHAALVFYWSAYERQVCITGIVAKASIEESKAYFDSRPKGSRLATWVSKQSVVIPNREVLDEKLAELTSKYSNNDIPLPSYWGGYVLSPDKIEFWQGRPNRLHDRFRYTKQSNKTWTIDRLSP